MHLAEIWQRDYVPSSRPDLSLEPALSRAHQLLSHWRRAQLKAWRSALDEQRRQHGRLALQLWPRLHAVLQRADEERLPLLQQFLASSTVGQWPARLALLRVLSGLRPADVLLANVVAYYTPIEARLARWRHAQRQQLQERLRGVLRLQAWDDRVKRRDQHLEEQRRTKAQLARLYRQWNSVLAGPFTLAYPHLPRPVPSDFRSARRSAWPTVRGSAQQPAVARVLAAGVGSERWRAARGAAGARVRSLAKALQDRVAQVTGEAVAVKHRALVQTLKQMRAEGLAEHEAFARRRLGVGTVAAAAVLPAVPLGRSSGPLMDVLQRVAGVREQQQRGEVRDLSNAQAARAAGTLEAVLAAALEQQVWLWRAEALRVALLRLRQPERPDDLRFMARQMRWALVSVQEAMLPRKDVLLDGWVGRATL